MSAAQRIDVQQDVSCGMVNNFLLALLLLVLGIFANNHNAALALDNLALFADGFYGRSYFHCTASLFIQSISSCCAR